MITKDNIVEILLSESFNFKKRGNIYFHHYGPNSSGFEIGYDEKKKQFLYPEGVEYDRSTTMDNHQKESYVVFLCVAQLFARGYEPKHIKLEGKNYQSLDKGYCDVLVRDGSKDKEEFLIIECKTADLSKKTDEFRKHWAKTLRNGDQLFRYFNTYRKAKYLCMYSADYPEYSEGGTKKHRFENIYYVISLVDNEKILADPKKQSFKELRENQGGSDEFFKVWKSTYHQDKNSRGIFEPGIEAFSIGKKSYNIDDLDPVDEYMLGKKYNDFAVILRKHTVSSHENAFDKLVNLFLAKIVDETKNPEELSFQWKGASYDDYFSLQDRLTVLYQEGMKNFFDDEVSYVEDKKIDEAFKFLTSKADVARDQIKKYFHELKYYNNNPFAFLDVHNEELFFQNAIILTDVISMIQDIHLTEHNDNNQFLGDLFEGFLNKGVHQSEGQFFTPIPIVRFLVSSLPIEKVIGNGTKTPKVIDYACGAGHFLTEYARQIRPYVIATIAEELSKIQSDTEKGLIIRNRLLEHYCQIKGVEKDYRLSKVSQVAAYMYGMDGIEIHFADGLSDIPGIKDGSFNVLIANPPYSVSGFLESLPDDILEKYTLYDESLSIDKNKAIETFFIERAVQLLAPDGVAAIILPNSVLTNDGLYMRSRELILKNFDIVAICEFGGRTFGQTNTNTITLFLRKKSSDNNIAAHYQNRVDEWFKGNMADDECYNDTSLLHAYISNVGFNMEDYLSMLKGELTESFINEERVKDYIGILLGGKVSVLSAEAKKVRDDYSVLIGRKGYEALAQEVKERQKRQAIIAFVQAIEKEKLYYYLLASSNLCPVLIIKSPENTKSDNKIEQRFLGYEWSNRKGDEGLKYLNVKTSKKSKDDEASDDDTISQVKGINGIITPLFNPLNLNDEDKINTLIRKNFNNELDEIPEELSYYVNLFSLNDLINFKQTEFNKIINKKTELSYPQIETKYETMPLGKIAPYVSEKTRLANIELAHYITTANMLQNRGGVEPLVSAPEVDSITAYKKGDILVSNIRPYLKKSWLAEYDGGCSNDVLVFRNAMPQKVMTEYLYNIMSLDVFFDYMMVGKRGIKMPRGDKKSILNFLIPIPSNDIQKQIIKECSKIEKKLKHNKQTIVSLSEQIYSSLDNYTNKPSSLKLENICRMQAGKFVKASDIHPIQDEIYKYPCYGGNGFRGYTDTMTNEGTYTLIGRQGALCGNINVATGQFHATEHAVVVYPNEDIVDSKWLRYTLEKMNLNQYATGVAQPGLSVQRVLQLSVEVPPLSEQKIIISEIERIENQIAEAQSYIDNSAAMKQQILNKYLK